MVASIWNRVRSGVPARAEAGRRGLPCRTCGAVTAHRLYQTRVGYELARDRLDYTAWVCTRCGGETREPPR